MGKKSDDKKGSPKNDTKKVPSFLICSHLNMHRKPEATTDLILMAEYLLNNYHINQYGVDLGLEAFAPDFNYNYKDRDSSITRQNSQNLTSNSSSSADQSTTAPNGTGFGTPSFSSSSSYATTPNITPSFNTSTMDPPPTSNSGMGTPSFNTPENSCRCKGRRRS